MADKPPAFVVNDRRKFTSDGDLREETPTADASAAPPAPAQSSPAPQPAPAGAFTANAVHPAPGQFGARAVEAAAEPANADAVHPAPGQFHANAVHPAPGMSARVVTMPSPASTAATSAPAPAAGPVVVSAPPPQAATAPPEDLQETLEDAVEDGDVLPDFTAAESAEQHAAYQETSKQLDDMIRQANPGMQAAGPVTIEQVFQSVYLSAVVAMGAATEHGQKPRIDIIGARQSIDMLTVIEEKTRGNLNDNEQRLLQNMLFETRMMFLEITNAIANQAHQPPSGLR